ncbi:MAG: ATP-dependent Clp protease proteolytic subunit [Tenericutes bacterium HGW-Tenericutes-4]|nr:MAG: ATP-dependent Clp protease proteolytic subunit [Tenericutes bacterium HGW-Tenericutes-4]
MLIPMVIDQVGSVERSYDIYSRLLEDRIVFVTGEITMDMANLVVAQLLYLEAKDNKKQISLYINSPGGSVDAGLSIFDTIQCLKCEVSTICVGLAASMAAILLACGQKGKRFSLPNSRIMIHEPSGGMNGKASDIQIAAEQIIKFKDKINKLLSDLTGQSVEKIKTDSVLDYYLDAKSAIEYGIIDKIIEKKRS